MRLRDGRARADGFGGGLRGGRVLLSGGSGGSGVWRGFGDRLLSEFSSV